jgi:hypothetical protein
VEYYKTIIYTLEEKQVQFLMRIPTLATTCVRSGNKKVHTLVQQEGIERVGHNIRNLWNNKHRVAGHSSYIWNQQPITTKYTSLNIYQT